MDKIDLEARNEVCEIALLSNDELDSVHGGFGLRDLFSTGEKILGFVHDISQMLSGKPQVWLSSRLGSRQVAVWSGPSVSVSGTSTKP